MRGVRQVKEGERGEEKGREYRRERLQDINNKIKRRKGQRKEETDREKDRGRTERERRTLKAGIGIEGEKAGNNTLEIEREIDRKSKNYR